MSHVKQRDSVTGMLKSAGKGVSDLEYKWFMQILFTVDSGLILLTLCRLAVFQLVLLLRRVFRKQM